VTVTQQTDHTVQGILTPAAEPVPPEEPVRRRGVLGAVIRSPKGAAGVGMLLLVVAGAVIAAWVAPHTATATDGPPLTGPTASYWLGTDNLGRDMLVRIAVGIRVSLLVSIGATLLAAVLGGLSGLLAGFVRGRFDSVVMRWWDVVLAFPSIILAIAVAAVLGAGVWTAVIAIAVVGMPSFARLARSSTLSERTLDYVAADLAAGASRVGVLVRAVLPNVAGPLVVYFTISVPHAIVLEASLSYLGLGQQPPTPSLGGMISAGQQYMAQAPHFIVFPSIALFLIIVSILLIGQRLSDALDPSRRYRMARRPGRTR
jgi:ABC-type dipeptide/oligopeptide/nickel transport system permease subunit